MKHKTIPLVTIAFIAILSLWGGVVNAQINNGGFENGDFSDWNVISGSPIVDSNQSNGGSYSAYFQSDGVIEQNLSVVNGGSYTGYVYFLSGSGAVMQIEYVNADNSAVYASSELPDGAVWDEISTNFTTASDNLLIRISHVAGNDGFVDDVSLTLVATPTPTSTPTNTPTPTITPTPTNTPTPGPTSTPSPTSTPGPTGVTVQLPSGAEAQVTYTVTAGEIFITIGLLLVTAVTLFSQIVSLSRFNSHR